MPDRALPEIPLDTPGTCREAEPFALRILDDSMAPELPRGCVVIVDPTGHARDGALVLAETGDGLAVRRLRLGGDGAATLEALAPGWSSIRPPGGTAAVRGVVTQRAGRRRRDRKRYD